MSKNRKGYYVEYADNEGRTKKAAVYYDEQKPAFSQYKRLFARCVNDAYLPIRDTITGKEMITLLYKERVKIIGYFD